MVGKKEAQKASHFHNVTADDAQAAVMSTRPRPTQALSITLSFSVRKGFFFIIFISIIKDFDGVKLL